MTVRSARGFRYPLEALRAKSEWELNALKLELAAENARVAALEEARRTAEARLADAASDWMRQLDQRKQFDAHAQRMVNAYLGQLRHVCETQQQMLADATRSRDDVLSRVLDAQRYLDRIDQHRDDALKSHEREAAKLAYRAADDDMVQRARWGEAR